MLISLVTLNFPISAFADAYLSGLSGEKKLNIIVDDFSPIILIDKANEYYEIRERFFLKDGLSTLDYSIRKINSTSFSSLVGGREDAESGGCTRSKLLGLDVATNEIVLEIKKINKDEFFDIFTSYTIENCTTREKTKLTKIFYATENGFEEKQEQEKK